MVTQDISVFQCRWVTKPKNVQKLWWLIGFNLQVCFGKPNAWPAVCAAHLVNKNAHWGHKGVSIGKKDPRLFYLPFCIWLYHHHDLWTNQCLISIFAKKKQFCYLHGLSVDGHGRICIITIQQKACNRWLLQREKKHYTTHLAPQLTLQATKSS